jgi:sulfide:quinone oxidoreductase
VVIAGGGVAAIETTFALRDFGDGRLDVTLVASSEHFVYRPIAVLEPFVGRSPRSLPLTELAAATGAHFVHDALLSVDVGRRIVKTASGAELPYDALAVAVGAAARECLDGARTIDAGHMGESLRALLTGLDDGSVSRIAFVVPTSSTWPLPAYELALLTSAHARKIGRDHHITVVTVEDAPLAVFGASASEGVADLLLQADIELVTAATVELPTPGELVVSPGERRLPVDYVIAMPELVEPAIEGLPCDSSGFVPVLSDGSVRGVERVYAAGDATDFPIKHGGLAGQQADVVAASIAALAGRPVEPGTSSLVLTGILLTGGAPRYLSARITDEGVRDSSISDTPTWSPVAKIGAPKLGAYLDERWAWLERWLFNATRDPLTFIRST